VPDLLVRTIATDLTVQGDGRTIVGLIAPYGRATTVDDGFGPYQEVFDQGCLDRAAKGRASYVRVLLDHGPNMIGPWVGRGERWTDSDDGMRMIMRLDDTEAGRTAAFKVRDGQTPGLSMGFVEGRSYTADDGTVHRRTIRAVPHVALVAAGAYPDARVEALRSAPLVAPARTADRVDYWRTFTERVRRT
jgi:HK97 family phage prohead protease